MTVHLQQINSKYERLPRSMLQISSTKDDFDACQRACEYNLTDYPLPQYWKIKNYLLYIMASSG
ncbi:hypothetical protein LTR37_008326 [Vermiconidia calcicola]|uniref:Uncharacterized protein n=1 Tax=Vermiconidia calcicola TaxID=1690605 RepID=A0ACC3NAS4_9PEZI|nr:hypothetical protein LTR37_008326 [Vermiconidia calcicola]